MVAKTFKKAKGRKKAVIRKRRRTVEVELMIDSDIVDLLQAALGRRWKGFVNDFLRVQMTAKGQLGRKAAKGKA